MLPVLPVKNIKNLKLWWQNQRSWWQGPKQWWQNPRPWYRDMIKNHLVRRLLWCLSPVKTLEEVCQAHRWEGLMNPIRVSPMNLKRTSQLRYKTTRLRILSKLDKFLCRECLRRSLKALMMNLISRLSQIFKIFQEQTKLTRRFHINQSRQSPLLRSNFHKVIISQQLGSIINLLHNELQPSFLLRLLRNQRRKLETKRNLWEMLIRLLDQHLSVKVEVQRIQIHLQNNILQRAEIQTLQIR